MREWTELRDAYGAAGEVPALLARVAPDPRDPVWDELWSRLCHQGTVYSASFAALPSLLAAARSWPPAQRVMPLCLAGAIVASDDVDGPRDQFLAGSPVAMSELRELALASLTSPGVQQADFINVAQAALAFEGETLWSRQLDHLVDGEFQGECTSCGAELYVAVGQYGFFLTDEEWVKRPKVKRTPIMPASVDALSGTARWLLDRSLQAGHDVVARWVEHLFGSAACPSCGSTVRVEEAIRSAAA